MCTSDILVQQTMRNIRSLLLTSTLLALTWQSSFAKSTDWRALGISEYNARRYDMAAKYLRSAVSTTKGDGLAHYYLANALLKTGRKQDAAVEYKRAFYLSNSNEMMRNCAIALKSLNVPIPSLPREGWKSRSARANLSAVTTSSAAHLSNLASHQFGDQEKESHPGGLEQFKSAPESSGDLGRQWDRWIENFRLQFNTYLFSRVGGAKRAVWGNTKMVFSIDAKGKLRGKILESGSPYFFKHYLLETTRHLDHTQGLRFPDGSKIDGFNFTMGWPYGQEKRIDRDTMIELKRIAAALKRNPITGERATAGRLATGSGNTSVAITSVDASLRSTDTSAALADKVGLETQVKAGKLPLPSFETSVAGLVLPKKKKEQDSKPDSNGAKTKSETEK